LAKQVFREIEKYKTIPDQSEKINPARWNCLTLSRYAIIKTKIWKQKEWQIR
jgi:hypothetical protein